MTRSVPLRRSPLRPGSKPLRRRTPLRKVNAKRKARLYERNFGEYSDFIRSLPCAVPGCRRRDIQAAHVVQCRGMGGCKGDKTGLAPLCGSRERAGHHQEEEGGTAMFEAKYHVDLRGLAKHLWQTYGATERFRAARISSVGPGFAEVWKRLAAQQEGVPS